MCVTLALHPHANANDDSLISVAEDFLLPSSPTSMDFTDESDGDETFLELGNSSLFELMQAKSLAWIKVSIFDKLTSKFWVAFQFKLVFFVFIVIVISNNS